MVTAQNTQLSIAGMLPVFLQGATPARAILPSLVMWGYLWYHIARKDSRMAQ